MPNISCKLYPNEILLGLEGDILSTNLPRNVILNGAVFNSLVVSQGNLFFALRNGVTDGHLYIEDAIKRGANCIMLEEIPEGLLEKYPSDSKTPFYFIQVKDTLLALQKLAKYYRDTVFQDAKVVAVTGSVGKTSLVRALDYVCSMFRVTHSPAKNFNNHIGLPITILNASRETEIFILEMGMNHPGEIELLSKIAQPDIAIITNVHPVHIGNFDGDIERIAMAKSEIISGLKKGGILVLNQDNQSYPLIKEIANKRGIKNILTIGGTEKSHVFLSNCEIGDLYTIDYKIGIRSAKAPSFVSGVVNSIFKHDAFSMLFVYAVAKLFNFDESVVSQAIIKVPVPEGRGNIERIFIDGKKITVVNGSYNASPPSVKDGIVSIAKLKEVSGAKRSLCVLGDMLELGDKLTEPLHIEIGDILKSSKIDRVITVGDFTKYTMQSLPQEMVLKHFKHSLSLSKKIRSLVEDGDIILFKGSNGINLTMAVDKLYR